MKKLLSLFHSCPNWVSYSREKQICFKQLGWNYETQELIVSIQFLNPNTILVNGQTMSVWRGDILNAAIHVFVINLDTPLTLEEAAVQIDNLDPILVVNQIKNIIRG